MSNFWEKKQISVTGGEGFLGRHLVRILKKKKTKKNFDSKTFRLRFSK